MPICKKEKTQEKTKQRIHRSFFLLILIFIMGPPFHHHHHLSLNHEGRWGTTDDFTTSFVHFSLFSIGFWDLANPRPVHSLMLSSHLFFCLPCLLPPFTVPCKMVLAWPDEQKTTIPLQFESLYDSRGFCVVWLLAGSLVLYSLTRTSGTYSLHCKSRWNRTFSISLYCLHDHVCFHVHRTG